MRLLPAVNTTVTPRDSKRRILATMAKLLPRMRLAPYASAVMHPLMLALRDSREAEVCADALAAICSVAVAVGDSMTLFVPTVNSVIAAAQAHGAGGMLPLERWGRLVHTIERGESPCSHESEVGGGGQWDDASGWAAEMDAVTYNHRLCDPPVNAPASQHRGPRRFLLALEFRLTALHLCACGESTAILR